MFSVRKSDTIFLGVCKSLAKNFILNLSNNKSIQTKNCINQQQKNRIVRQRKIVKFTS